MQKIRSVAVLILLSFCSLQLFAQLTHQPQTFTHADTLRGTISAERSWWNVTKYDLTCSFDFNKRSIVGSNIISYQVVSTPTQEMQIDLQVGLDIDSVILNGKSLTYRRDGNAYFVSVPQNQEKNAIQNIIIYYHGIPRPAIRPPWDGGLIWSKDKNGNPWISVACQGLGASVWYPCKDHQSDEPDSASITMIVPDTLVAVSNGRLRKKISNGDGTAAYTWAVTNPINNYNIIPYIGKYVHWHENFPGEKGNLDCDYWVLDYNIDKAKEQFTQAVKMLKCFEHWFGPYPFYEDGYKLVESPHLGMEHQSAVAYGNNFANGYRGTDLSGTGWGLKWDFILVHESGHEWFGNNVTSNDVADMWIHESFTNYSETIFTTCEFGNEAGNDYVIGTRAKIQNQLPVQGPYGVNQEGSGDMYYKGGNMIHAIRQVVNDDEKFRKILRGLNEKFYHKTVDAKDIESYINKASGIDFSKVFDQYLRKVEIPALEYKIEGKKVSYRWTRCVDGFNLPLKVTIDGKVRWIKPAKKWKTLKLNQSVNEFSVDRNFYVEVKKM